jgi:predicted XRE-type DNA-binding protein
VKRMPEHQESSGNVFADLGPENAPELQAKADLALEISRTLEERGFTQAQAAELLGIDQPKVSALVRGRLSGFSMERLYRFLNALGKDVEIVVRAAERKGPNPSVHVMTPDRKLGKPNSAARSKERRQPAGSALPRREARPAKANSPSDN